MYKLQAPIYITIPMTRVKDKNIPLSLSWYRNCHYMVSNKVKRIYEKLMNPQIIALPMFDRISISMVYYSRTKQRSDLDNWCSLNNKFFQDCLSKAGKIEDDNYAYVPSISYSYGGQDLDKKGKILITIKELK